MFEIFIYSVIFLSTGTFDNRDYEVLISTKSSVKVTAPFDCYKNYICPKCRRKCDRAIKKDDKSKIHCNIHGWVDFKMDIFCWQ